MVDRERVNLVVAPEQKERWDNAVEESPEYSSLSDLIRRSVAHELSDESGAATTPQEPPQPAQIEAHAETLEEVTDTLTRMENTLTDLEGRLTNVEREVTAAARADLKNEVFDALPTPPQHIHAKEVAEKIGADRDRVSRVLRKLDEQTAAIEIIQDDEHRSHYARKEDQ
jgi:hypothetical protein